jgi:hypothetical protein
LAGIKNITHLLELERRVVGYFERLRYDTAMKTPPDNPEFARFTEAMRGMMKVSKVELQRRMEAARQTRRARSTRAARVAGAQPKRAT